MIGAAEFFYVALAGCNFDAAMATHVGEGIDLAVLSTRYQDGLIEHPVNDNDTVLTSKFVAGGETAENARTAHARRVMSEGGDNA